MSGTNTPVNPLELSDEEFLNLNSPPVAEATGEGEAGGQGEGSDNGSTAEDGEGDGDPNTAAAGGTEGDAGQSKEDSGKNDGEDDTPSGKVEDESGNLATKDKSQEQEPAGNKPVDTKNPDPNAEGKGKSGKDDGSQGDNKNPLGSSADGQAAPPDYEGMYKKLMAPLKANGKTIDLKNPEEAIQLMQMGANYTRKMQALAPHRKLLLMLENNGLLDEGKLSFLIDIEKKNPEAIKKFIKDAGLDPREIDLDDPAAKPYLEGNHRVTDEESNFRSILDELSSNPEGKETLQTIQTQWDQASKEVLWKQPDVMQLIHQQRENGIYDRISTELERQRALGMIPSNVPFLQAYKVIGDQLAAANAFDDLLKPAAKQQQQPAQAAPVATTVQKVKPVAANGDKVSAASPTRSTPRKAETTVNPLALSDEDFMKQVSQFEGRL